VKRTFRSLNSFNYRAWVGGTLVSNVGTWMQRTTQDWLVLTQLTHGNATAVGVTMALQFAAIFGFGCALAAIMPNRWLFGLALLIIGVSAQTFTISTNSLVQLSTEPVMRGRVMAILLAIALGGAPIGAPIVGWVADRFGPRWALGVWRNRGLGRGDGGDLLPHEAWSSARIDFGRLGPHSRQSACKSRRRRSRAPTT
jgi:MFS family permease